ncbi:MAG: FAD-dependent oxidoreductase [Holophagales bacterium]|nr:FAD-dependent oxidoreductase [Holophagales bacterium]
MTNRTSWDAVVVGAGVGGLVAAGLLARSGRRVLLLEAHETPGGCAGFYEAGGFTFDAGATTLIGFDPGDPLATIAEALGIRLGEDLRLEPVDGVDVQLPGVSFFYGRDRPAWEKSAVRLFPGASSFFRRLRRDAALLWGASRSWPVLPLLSPRDAIRDLRLLSPRLLPLLPSFGKTVSDVLERERAPADPALRAFLDLALLISVQSPASAAPWWNGALGIDLFRRGVSRARGGMRAFAGALALAVERAGGEIRTRTLVTRLAPSSSGWVVKTASGEEFAARTVLPNLPVRDVARLLDPGTVPERTAASEHTRLGDGWGALVLNLGLSRVVNDDPRRLHRLVATRLDGHPGDGTSLFLSFSPPATPSRRREARRSRSRRTSKSSTWAPLRGEEYRRKKEEARLLLREALEREVPGLAAAVAYEDLGTPRTFQRYTRRSGGSVGGVRMTRGSFGLNALDPTLGAEGLHVVGDTAFPGQGTLAVAMSAALAAERLGAVRLERGGTLGFLAGGTR